jgi:hypothetical protein
VVTRVCFFIEGDPAAERWVQEKARAVLDGKASTVAAAIRRKATRLGLEAKQRGNADTAAHYLRPSEPTSTTRPRLRTGGRSRPA